MNRPWRAALSGVIFKMFFKVPVKGYFEVNSYFYVDDNTKHSFLIDPGAESHKFLNFARDNGLLIEKILLTHGHFDHMGGISDIKNVCDVPVYAYENSDIYLLDPSKNLSRYAGDDIIVRNANYFKDGEIINFHEPTGFSLKVIYAPGHTEDSVVFYSKKDNLAFVGDTIFQGSIGTTVFPGGNENDLIKSITEKIFTLPDNTVLLSGHSEQTTVQAERRRYNF